jgi:hypothetical protein
MKKNNGKELLEKEANRVNKEKEIEDDEIEMSKSELLDEHINLIRILRSGDKKAQEAEARKQEKELRSYR